MRKSRWYKTESVRRGRPVGRRQQDPTRCRSERRHHLRGFRSHQLLRAYGVYAGSFNPQLVPSGYLMMAGMDKFTKHYLSTELTKHYLNTEGPLPAKITCPLCAAGVPVQKREMIEIHPGNIFLEMDYIGEEMWDGVLPMWSGHKWLSGLLGAFRWVNKLFLNLASVPKRRILS